jgi:hypothetical protein
MKRLGSLALVVVMGSVAWPQAKQEKPLTMVNDEERGIVMMKPKDEKWEIKKGGEGAKVFSGGSALVSHRIDLFTIEVVTSVKEDNQTFGTLKEVADKTITQFETDKDGKAIPDRKVIKRKNEESKFPGAGNPKAWFLDIAIEEKGNKTPMRIWTFIDEKDKNKLVRVSIFGGDDLYKKYEKDVNYVCATLQTYKVKKK